MRIADFALERYFARWEFAVRHVLGASDVEPFSLAEVLALADDDSRRRWDSLSLGYTETAGLPALRAEIASLYHPLGAEDVLTFAGAEEGVFVAMHAMLEAGDHAVVVWPAYQSLFEIARSIGASITFVPLDPRDWSLDVNAIAAAMRPNTRVIVVNFPHSPTGAQLEPDGFARLTAIAELHGVHLFSDEVYRFLEHDRRPLPGAASVSPRGVSLGVMSKAFGMPGARIGWIATSDQTLRKRIAALRDYTTICSSAPSEVLALIGLRARERVLDRAHEILSANLRLLDDFFTENDRFTWVRPRAGSVCFPEKLDGPIDRFAADLAERTGVLVLPSSQFGYAGDHFRLGFGRRDMPVALELMAEFAASWTS